MFGSSRLRDSADQPETPSGRWPSATSASRRGMLLRPPFPARVAWFLLILVISAALVGCSERSSKPVQPAAVAPVPPSGLATPQPEPEILTYPLAQEFSGFSQMGDERRARTVSADKLLRQVCTDGKSACIKVEQQGEQWAVSRHGLTRRAGKAGAIVWCGQPDGLRSMWSTEFRFSSADADGPSFPDHVNIWSIGKSGQRAVLVDQVWNNSPDGPNMHVVDIVSKPLNADCPQVLHVSSGPGTTVTTDGTGVEVTFPRQAAQPSTTAQTDLSGSTGSMPTPSNASNPSADDQAESATGQTAGQTGYAADMSARRYCVYVESNVWYADVSEEPDFDCGLKKPVSPVETFASAASSEPTPESATPAPATSDPVTSDPVTSGTSSAAPTSGHERPD